MTSAGAIWTIHGLLRWDSNRTALWELNACIELGALSARLVQRERKP